VSAEHLDLAPAFFYIQLWEFDRTKKTVLHDVHVCVCGTLLFYFDEAIQAIGSLFFKASFVWHPFACSKFVLVYKLLMSTVHSSSHHPTTTNSSSKYLLSLFMFSEEPKPGYD
jgi:hypothetical protein